MASSSNHRGKRRALLLALLALSAPALLGDAAAAPGAKPSPKDESQQRAEAEFEAGSTALGSWCEALTAAEQAHPDEIRWTLRRAQCVRMIQGTKSAQDLLAAATERVGPSVMSTARAALDAELGAAIDDPRRTELEREIEQHWRAACEHFAISLEAESSPGTQLAVAACQLRAGKLSAASVMISAAQATLEPLASSDDARAQQLALARWLRQELERVQPSVTLRAHGGFSGTVQVANTELAPARPLPLDPGQHPIAVKLSNAKEVDSALTAAPTQRFELHIDEPRRKLGSGRKVLVWGGFGLGAAGAVTAGIMYWSAQNKWSSLERAGCTRSSRLGGGTVCPSSASESLAKSYNRALDVFQISSTAAAVLLATATVSYLTAPRAETFRLVPLTDGSSAGAAFTGSF